MPETEIILKKKRIPNEKFWIIYKLLHILFLGHCYSQVFICQSTMAADIFTQYPLLPTHHHHKKASHGPEVIVISLDNLLHDKMVYQCFK